MSERFIITGLPRSRTGWLANLFNYGPCFCLHDGCQFGKKGLEERLKGLEESGRYAHVGNSDSVYSLDRSSLTGTEKVIVVCRNAAEAEASFVAYFKRHPYPQMTHDAMALHDRYCCAVEGMRELIRAIPTERLRLVGFGDLNQMEQCEALWNFICPEEKFNRDRWDVLDKLRVNPASEKVFLWDS